MMEVHIGTQTWINKLTYTSEHHLIITHTDTQQDKLPHASKQQVLITHKQRDKLPHPGEQHSGALSTSLWLLHVLSARVNIQN